MSNGSNGSSSGGSSSGSNNATRNALIGILGLILLVAPMLVRFSMFGDQGSYTPPEIEDNFTAATPIPTVTALAQRIPALMDQSELRAGPVVIDLAHFNFLDITKFQPLSSALAQRGIGTRFWLPVGIDATEINSFLDFPDQSEKLAAELNDASALVIVSPFFLWSPEEREVVRDFVADGGRLLLISDPDIMGDLAQTMNLLAEPFGVVFNDDYLYNTDRNDENFTYTFQGEFLDRAADLAGSEVVFYGARSIVGSVVEQVRSSDTTLSSSRTGRTSFTTVAVAGLSSTETEERVLAMSDFDVLSEPFVDRYDNAQMLGFVADFLAGGGRTETLVDFPGTLGKEVALVYGTQETVDAELLSLSAQLQQRLTRSGREMRLAQSAPLNDGQIISSTQLLTGPLGSLVLAQMEDVVESLLGNDADIAADGDVADEAAAGDDEQLDATSTLPPAATAPEPQPLPDGDLIYLADFETAGEQEMLLADAGFTLIHVARTPTPTPTMPPTPTPTSTPTPAPTVPTFTPTPASLPDVSIGASLTETGAITSTGTITSTGLTTDTVATGDDREGEDDGTGAQAGDDTSNSPAAQAAPINQSETVSVSQSISSTQDITDAAGITSTVALSPTETAEPEPVITAYLISESGLQLLASETVLIFQQQQDDGETMVAVLGESAAAINAGVERLLERNFEDCIVDDEQAICPFVNKNTKSGSGSGSSSSGTGSSGGGESDGDANGLDAGSDPGTGSDESNDPGSSDGDSPDEDSDPGGSDDEPDADPEDEPSGDPVTPQEAKIIIVDDNVKAEDGEVSEAEVYMAVLTELGANPAVWSVADSGTPPTDLLTTSDWLIWSSGGYSQGGPVVADLDPLFEVLNVGGRVTISSQNTFFGQTQDPPSELTDIQVTGDVGKLTGGIPSDPIALTTSVQVAPIQANTEENPTLSVAIRRGPSSEDADEPVLFILVDEETPEATGARLMVLGMSVSWLPSEVQSLLIENTMNWMLEPK